MDVLLQYPSSNRAVRSARGTEPAFAGRDDTSSKISSGKGALKCRSSLVLGAVVFVAVAGAPARATDPTAKCKATKLKAAGKEVSAKMVCYEKAKKAGARLEVPEQCPGEGRRRYLHVCQRGHNHRNRRRGQRLRHGVPR
jgi:hypothetical protein